MLVDTHCHLFFPEYDTDRDIVIERALAAGIKTMVVVGTDLPSSKKAIALAEQYPFLFATVGLHPHEASAMDDGLLQEFEQLSAHPKVVAIGEAGLDFYYNRSAKEAQQSSFRAQIALAQKRRLPLVIHTRDAWEETFAMLKEHDPDYFREIGSVFHCFTGDAEIAARGTAMGIYISFSGIVTFSKTESLQKAAATVDSRYLLIETDAPFLAPQGFRGKRNEPSYIKTTAEKIALLRRCSLEVIEKETTENAERLFRWPGLLQQLTL